MNVHEESSSDQAEQANRQPSRKRKWYRKRTRDPNFRKQLGSDTSSNSAETSDISEPSPQRRKEPGGTDLSSHSDDEEENSEGVNPVEPNNKSSPDPSIPDNASETSDGGDNGNDELNIDPDSDCARSTDGNDDGPDLYDQPPDDAGGLSDEEDKGEGSGSDANGRYGESEEESVYSSTDSGEEEEEEDEGEVEDDLNHDNDPIFNGASITRRESALAILTFILSHKLTGLCVTDLLSLLSLHCGPNNILLKTLHKFKKYFKMIGKDFVKLHFYCPNCEKLVPNKNAVCCANQQLDTYFIEFPIVSQLQNLFARPGFYEELQYRFTRVKKDNNNVEEIFDGTVYQELFNNGFLNNPNNISFFMYFDGVSIFKSSNFSIWPAYLTINELKYNMRMRKENTILSGLWFGKNKPNSNLFLSPLHECMISLEANGANMTLPNGQIINVKAKILGAVADMPAKALFMRFIQYNGAFSCFICMAQGGRYALGNNATIQVFPYCRNIELRNINDTIDFASQALLARQQNPDANVYGVKAPSILSSLLPNMILCMGIDIMHGVFLGLMRTNMHLWFDVMYSASPFSISDLVHIVDGRLKNIKPPCSFQNVTRSIKKDMAKWKAFDLKAFFFYYSLVVLHGILPNMYWLHHVLLVTSISILCQESISPVDFDSAERMLHLYVSQYEELYGVRHMTLTIHQLLHLPFVCKNLGPAWVYSCFSYESLNGELVRLVHGTRHVALQICSSAAVYMKLPVMISALPDTEVKALCLKFQRRSAQKVIVTENIDILTGVVGSMKTCYPIPKNISRLLQDNFDIVGGRCKYFYRLKRKGLVYSSELYTRAIKKISYFVEIFYNSIPYLCKIHYFIKWSSCVNNCPLGCAACPRRYFCVVTVYDRLVWELHNAPINNVVPHLNKVSPKDETKVFPVESITAMCIYMPVDGKEYIAVPVNNLEVE